MYTAYIGKRLIDCLNRRDGTAYTPRSFFDEVYFPLFFANERYLQNVNNSPVDQASKNRKRNPVTSEVLAACLARIHEKADGGAADASMFLGGPAANTTETTSGQVTNIARPIAPSDIYASWIGDALSVRVEGGLSLLIDSEDVLLALFDGWRRYRAILDQNPVLKPLQIQTWNGRWLAWRFGAAWDADAPLGFEPKLDNATGTAAYDTQPWVQLLFSLSFHFQGGGRILTAYSYSLGQTNRTAGFVRLNLPQVQRLSDMYRTLFEAPKGLSHKAFEELYNTQFGFHYACQFVDIGLRALEPKGLTAFLRGQNLPKTPGRDGPEKLLTFQTYQTWIIAMLNNKELLEFAEALARALNDVSRTDTRGKTVKSQAVKNVLDAPDRRRFIEELIAVVEDAPGNAVLWDRAVNEITTMPAGNVPLFLTLVRFKHALASKTP